MPSNNEQQIDKNENYHFYQLCHDIKSPIYQVKGLLKVLKSHIAENPEAMKVLGMAVKSNENLLQLVESQLTNQEYKKSKSQIINFPSLINDIQDQLRMEGNFEGVKLITNIDKDLKYFGDANLLYSVVLNLIENSIKYRNPDKEECLIIFSVQQSQKHVIIKITDNGCGIHTDKLPYIFNKNYRGREHVEGTGMGLYLVKKALSDLNATIEVDSTLDEGTSMTIELPRPPLSVV